MAERMGFEPMVRSRGSLVFKTSSINHSDTSPQWRRQNAGIIIQKTEGVVNPFLQFSFKNYLRKNNGTYYNSQGVKPSLPSTCTLV